MVVDFDECGCYFNVRNMFCCLFVIGCVFVINENDMVVVEELMVMFGDNDYLVVFVMMFLGVFFLVIFLDVEGFYDGDLYVQSLRVILVVDEIGFVYECFVVFCVGGLGIGGMLSKFVVVQVVMCLGGVVIVVFGKELDVLGWLFSGEELGMFFLLLGKFISFCKCWFGFLVNCKGVIIVDEGVVCVICEQGKSLLVIGVICIVGDFCKGDVVLICVEFD